MVAAKLYLTMKPCKGASSGTTREPYSRPQLQWLRLGHQQGPSLRSMWEVDGLDALDVS